MDIKKLKKIQTPNRNITHRKNNDEKSIFHKEITLLNRFNNKDKEYIFSEIAMLLSSGIDLQTTLELCKDNNVNVKKYFIIYSKMLEEIIKGKSFTSSLQSTQKFNDFDCYSILVGENTGGLVEVLDKLTNYYDKKINQQRKITSALSYPIIILITTIGAVLFMLNFVVPMFADTLLKFGGELPGITKAVIYLSENITKYFFIFTLLSLGLFLYYQKTKNTKKTKKIISNLILRIPYIGSFIKKKYLVQFSETMHLLFSAKVNVLECIDMTTKMISFFPLTSSLAMIKQDLLQGSSLHHSMKKHVIFDSSIITLISIGEETNQMDKVFNQISKKYQADLDHQSNILITILEPIMIILLALIIGVILIAMYLPMFKMGSIVH